MRFQETPVLPRICVGPARAMYIGPGLALAPHFNVATTIAVSLSDGFSIRTWSRKHGWTDWQTSTAAIIPSETLHHLQSTGPMAFLYLDPLGDDRIPMNCEKLEAGRLRLIQHHASIGNHAAFDGFGLYGRKPVDARIAKVVLEIERQPHAFPSMQDAAAMACLSPSRFRARFSKATGLPFRRYRLWRRMACVMRTIAEGHNLTEAALQAGFASSAHLSSAFKHMFGLSASDILAMGASIDVSEATACQPSCHKSGALIV
jgi:AraC-like DNA-binding protein